jgi:hypothetical protein
MRKSRFIEAQIIGMIKEQEAGLSTVEVCRKHGLSTAEGQIRRTGSVRCPSAAAA